MNGVGRFSPNPNDEYNSSEIKPKYPKDNIELEDISILYTTNQTEDKRSEFLSTFSLIDADESGQGAKFLHSLIENKSVLMQKLGLSDEQYDSLACIALGLASQETGMGEEKGYIEENKGFGKFKRDVGKFFSTTFGGDASASSGLTQMKIYDFMRGNKLPDEYKQILKDFGIIAKGVNNNNLFSNPDKAAIATIVVLKSINDNYDEYTTMLHNEHERIASEFSASPEQLEVLETKGNELLNGVLNVYQNAPDDQKVEIRNAFKMWLLAQNGSTKGQRGVDKGYNEEENLEKLNKILAQNNPDFEPLTADSLNYIRYALTSEGNEMTPVEYMAYGWNKGTAGSGMQLDRTLAEKIGTILYNPEDFDYDQFTTNVAMLTQKYANQSVGENSLDLMNKALLDDI